LAFDASGNLFAANARPSTISKITSGGLMSVFSSGPPLDAPANLAFDASGDLFVANYNTNSILRITPSGVVSTFASSGLLDGPSGLVIQPVPSPVPEIDPNSLGSVLTLVLGSLGLLERRRLKAA